MYETFYKLKRRPFQLSPDPRFFFNSKGHKRALSYLRYGVKQGEGFIIVTGDVGTGKTTLVTALFKALEHEDVVAAQIVTTQLQADDMLRMVAAAFGLNSDRVGKATLLRNLENFFKACAQDGKRVLLVVDEAQGLPKKSIEELRMLSNFNLNGRALLQTFMLGQREFRATMRSEGFEQLRQRVIAAYHLKPLGTEETKGYVLHRLTTAGWQDSPTIAEEVFEAIHDFTGGVPRKINTLCDRLLLFGCLEELSHISMDAFRSVRHEIMDEQGATTQELRRVAPDAVPEPASKPASERKSSRKADAQNGAAEAQTGPDEQDRISAMERSVASLAEAMRDELALLRHALTESAGKKDAEEVDSESQK
ncbi:MAG: XrtA/PEP-CTERM system-associated ATPase [Pseudomonadota bacterium]